MKQNIYILMCFRQQCSHQVADNTLTKSKVQRDCVGSVELRLVHDYLIDCPLSCLRPRCWFTISQLSSRFHKQSMNNFTFSAKSSIFLRLFFNYTERLELALFQMRVDRVACQKRWKCEIRKYILPMSVRTMMRKYCNWTEISWTIRPDQLDPTTSYYSVSGGLPFLHRWRCNLRGKAMSVLHSALICK
ncbi:hypothetical protein T4E_655 [Trichinella pseudospiralis]|uniref:Uncharacterized protein n=1 Tax=Trichinella pseudospiralis TaxID=6337 RepID=A0A0V0YER1_TRIPS|nr:hypothetical protein T4E_655 [Trichinella pseudospiralis]